MTLYKIVGNDFESINGGRGTWFRPEPDGPGAWMPYIPGVQVCVRGYHLVSAEAIRMWLPRKGGWLCEAEGRGESDAQNAKIAFAQARLIKVVGLLDDVSMRLAAADMAERALPIFAAAFPDDKRPERAIQAARDFAFGKINSSKVRRAAEAAIYASIDAKFVGIPAVRRAAEAAVSCSSLGRTAGDAANYAIALTADVCARNGASNRESYSVIDAVIRRAGAQALIAQAAARMKAATT